MRPSKHLSPSVASRRCCSAPVFAGAQPWGGAHGQHVGSCCPAEQTAPTGASSPCSHCNFISLLNGALALSNMTLYMF